MDEKSQGWLLKMEGKNNKWQTYKTQVDWNIGGLGLLFSLNRVLKT